MSVSLPTAILFLFLFTLTGQGPGLQSDDFITGGNTYLTTDNCLRLTDNFGYMAGSIWHKKPVKLTKPFALKLSVMAGCKDGGGADGMVFVMTDRAYQTGYAGEGIGFAGLIPSLGIEIDTWQNHHLGDPAEDHLAIMLNGRVGHYRNLAGPTTIRNIEDCKQHNFIVIWNPYRKRISVEIDSKEVISAKVDLLKDVFGGNTHVYWGMTAATGRFSNVQEVCFSRAKEDSPFVRGK